MKKKPQFFSCLSRRLLIALACACVGTLLFVLWAGFASQPKLTPEELASQALANMLRTPLTYTSDANLTIEGQTLEYGNLSGIQDAAGNQYLTGTVLGDPVAIYYFGEDTYVKDPFTGLWRLAEKRDETLPAAPELSPLSDFKVSNVENCQLVETTGSFYNKVYHITCSVTPENQWINENFQDITYSLWIRGKNFFVEKAVITAETSYEETTGTLHIAIELQPYEGELLQRPLPE